MLSGAKLSKSQYSFIVNNRQQCFLIKQSLTQDLTKLMVLKAIPKLLSVADPTSGLSKTAFMTEATADSTGEALEIKTGIPAFKTAAVLNAGIQIKTMWISKRSKMALHKLQGSLKNYLPIGKAGILKSVIRWPDEKIINFITTKHMFCTVFRLIVM